ncbi:MAG: NAD-dependent epimerase/dehydratase family protein [Dehalococcoidia bacterium]|nr:NAD-dependent epimerase/dehydratase family protein [Dehalococcoidia bacterium]
MTTEESLASFYRHKAVLITGGLGFIGSNLARRLAELEAEVLVIDSLIPDYGGNLFNIDGVTDRVHVNIADVRDQNSMNYLVRGQDILFNLAGQVSHIDSMLDPYTDLEINCRSQLSLLEACRHNNPDVKVVYAGTRQVYGKPRYLPVDEDHLLQPTDVNGINTMAGEWYHILYNNVYGVRACSLRLTNTYGPRLLVKHNRQGFIGWFIRQALDGQEIQLFGDGLQQRDMIFVDDAVEAFLLAGMSEDANGQIFNVGGKERVSLLEFVQVLVETAQCGCYKLVPFPVERKSIDIGDYYADCSKIRRTLGWEARTDLREGLKKTIPFYLKHREHYW